MTKILLALVAALLVFSGLQSWRLSESRAAVDNLHSTVQVLGTSLAQSARASRVYHRKIAQVQAQARVATESLEKALAASPDWEATPVPPEVREALEGAIPALPEASTEQETPQ